jgi:hypothetical protein
MSFHHVLICDANQSEREIFSLTLSDCYINHCGDLEELNELLGKADVDAIFFGRSAIIELLESGSETLSRLSEHETPKGLYMFRVSGDQKIQVKTVKVLH